MTEDIEWKRPPLLHGCTVRAETGCGHLYITINHDEPDNGPIEIFLSLGKSGSCAKAELEAISRLVSIGLQGGLPISRIVKQLSGIQCPATVWQHGLHMLSCADAIAKTLDVA